MKELPILYNTEMVKAILDGRKTQTRRPIKPCHKEACGFNVNFDHTGTKVMSITDFDEHESSYDNDTRCPFGQIGDRLYVRETALYWRTKNGIDSVAAFKADGYELELGEQWIPSIHMPKKYARIWLEITDIRVERVQDITDIGAMDEGYSQELIPNYPVLWFASLWNDLYKNWSDNPFCWVVEFKRITK